MKNIPLLSLSAVFIAAFLSSFAAEATSKPSAPQEPPPVASTAQVPEGFRAEVHVSDLKHPTSLENEGDGNFYIAESGYFSGDDSELYADSL